MEILIYDNWNYKSSISTLTSPSAGMSHVLSLLWVFSTKNHYTKKVCMRHTLKNDLFELNWVSCICVSSIWQSNSYASAESFPHWVLSASLQSKTGFLLLWSSPPPYPKACPVHLWGTGNILAPGFPPLKHQDGHPDALGPFTSPNASDSLCFRGDKGDLSKLSLICHFRASCVLTLQNSRRIWQQVFLASSSWIHKRQSQMGQWLVWRAFWVRNHICAFILGGPQSCHLCLLFLLSKGQRQQWCSGSFLSSSLAPARAGTAGGLLWWHQAPFCTSI